MARHLDDLGPDFDLRWKQTTRARKRELIAELRELYILLEDDDLPLLAGATPAPAPAQSAVPAPVAERQVVSIPATPEAARPAVAQGTLFTDAGEESPARKENPFLPRSVLARLQDSQNQAVTGLRDLMHKSQEITEKRLAKAGSGLLELISSHPVSHEEADLERELRLKLGPVVESLLDAHMDALKSELRVHLRAEMDRLIAEHVRKK